MTEFRLLYSVQNRYDPSGLFTRKHGELQALKLDSAKLLSNKYLTSFFNNSCFIGFTLYGCCLNGNAIPTSMSCSIMVVQPGTSVNKLGKDLTEEHNFFSDWERCGKY